MGTTPNGEIIHLSVGGVEYKTTRATLCKYPNSMLGAMFSSTLSTHVDQTGCYFIDRDGEIFKYILNYLRSSRLSLPTGFANLDQLSLEADFYQILPLIKELKELKEMEQRLRVSPTHFLEIIEIRFGDIAVMPTVNSQIRTIISGRKDVILLSLPSQHIHPSESERLNLNSGNDFCEILLSGSNVRLRAGEHLKSHGWDLVESHMSTCPVGTDANDIVHSYKDRWMISACQMHLNKTLT
ncbi:hypothetical protein CHS0354_009206 [Potamilus streckersoni]|uniref:BTB domain-containing protein n=1 Tax=Potamilus streckersoni TaxID=2493646 RepID=A0AAE0SZ16_9BIVA|nr:hypothetical protein CHS0354_009206 [Potamilus streckersoni]